MDYQTNIANDVKLFTVTTTWNSTSGLYDTALGNAAANVFYTAAQLIKTVTYDENTTASPVETAGSTVEFKDKEGKVVLKRTYDAGVKHDTYYVYDIYGNLTYVIPPKADGSITTAVLNDLCYQYKYDYRNRLAEKKLPGKQWEFIVYDKLDRVVATGPANSPFSDLTTVGWVITKYDVFNRPVYTGWSTGTAATATGRITLQTAQNSASVINESRQISGIIDSIAAYYTNAVAPTAFKLLTVNYYDNYTFPSTPAITVPTAVETQTVLTTAQIKGLNAASWTRVPTTSTAVLGETSATFYNNQARAVRVYTTNHLGGYTYTDSRLDFSGKPQYTITRHRRLSADTELMTKDTFTYSAQDRLLTQTHQINSGTVELIASNTYDELGQLVSKKVGNTEAAPTQNVNYTYNIRGWLTAINDITTLTKSGDPKDLFAFKINYNTIPSGISGVLALYNGNIAETQWTSASETTPVIRTYGYKYDNLNRLKDAVFKRGTAAANNAYNETLTYDKNGNIMTLLRNGNSDTAANQIDNLAHTYLNSYSNQLAKVVDNATTYKGYGFVDSAANTVNDYTYDANGNMISDNNKNITAITYNHLNLPTKITFAATGNIVYIYNAAGQKVQKIVTSISPATVTTTDYLGGYQYDNAALKFFPTAEGYVEPVSGAYKYVYQYKDHLGNIRVSYDKTLAIKEESNFYPFGLKQEGYNNAKTGVENKYKYQGQELQDELGLNWYSFKYRNYDPMIARFMCVDPLASKYPYNGVYNFSENRVIDGVELEGLEVQLIVDKGNYVKGDVGHTFVSVGSGKNMTVYTYGRWAGTDANSSGVHTPLNNGNGVMVKLTGKDALAEVQKYVEKFGAEVYQINNANEKKVGATLENEYNKSDKTPETGKYKGDERAHVIDKYDISENNCTTKSLEAVNGAVPGGEIKYQTTVTAGGLPVVTEDGTKDTYAPKDLNRQLNQASQQSGTNVQKVTDKYD
nr:RHS repeat-associated core domain-containing protein [Flavobacterium sp. UBA7680]